MKALIVTIILTILAVFITGCDVVEKHYHGHERRVVVASPPPRMTRGPGRRPHPGARHRMEEQHRSKHRRMHH
jgi:hypothetical protein